jgi:hypothetical protein
VVVSGRTSGCPPAPGATALKARTSVLAFSHERADREHRSDHALVAGRGVPPCLVDGLPFGAPGAAVAAPAAVPRAERQRTGRNAPPEPPRLDAADGWCRPGNRSSQHLSTMEVAGGATAAVGGQGASPGDAVAGEADPGASCGAGVPAADRPCPRALEGDRMNGLHRSAIVTVLERSSRYTLLVHLPRLDDRRRPLDHATGCASRRQNGNGGLVLIEDETAGAA